MFGLTVDEFKQSYFPKYRESGIITIADVKDAKRCSDEFHDFLVNNRFFRVYLVLEFMIIIYLAFTNKLKDV